MLSVGMVLFLASELMFFSALFAMYFTLRAGATPWPPAGIELEVLPPTLFTALLVLSSATMQMAVRRVRAGRLDGLRRWTWLTILLAVGGILLMLVVLRRAGAGAYSVQEHAGVEVVSYYWHFVDVVWIAMFSTIFLLQ
jgi:cytochrome c oxidase subunit 3